MTAAGLIGDLPYNGPIGLRCAIVELALYRVSVQAQVRIGGNGGHVATARPDDDSTELRMHVPRSWGEVGAWATSAWLGRALVLLDLGIAAGDA